MLVVMSTAQATEPADMAVRVAKNQVKASRAKSRVDSQAVTCMEVVLLIPALHQKTLIPVSLLNPLRLQANLIADPIAANRDGVKNHLATRSKILS